MSKTKAEILRAKTAHEVFQWMKENPEQADAEVAAYFNELARKEYLATHPNPDLLWTPPNLK